MAWRWDGGGQRLLGLEGEGGGGTGEGGTRRSLCTLRRVGARRGHRVGRALLAGRSGRGPRGWCIIAADVLAGRGAVGRCQAVSQKGLCAISLHTPPGSGGGSGTTGSWCRRAGGGVLYQVQKKGEWAAFKERGGTGRTGALAGPMGEAGPRTVFGLECTAVVSTLAVPGGMVGAAGR